MLLDESKDLRLPCIERAFHRAIVACATRPAFDSVPNLGCGDRNYRGQLVQFPAMTQQRQAAGRLWNCAAASSAGAGLLAALHRPVASKPNPMKTRAGIANSMER